MALTSSHNCTTAKEESYGSRGVVYSNDIDKYDEALECKYGRKKCITLCQRRNIFYPANEF